VRTTTHHRYNVVALPCARSSRAIATTPASSEPPRAGQPCSRIIRARKARVGTAHGWSPNCAVAGRHTHSSDLVHASAARSAHQAARSCPLSSPEGSLPHHPGYTAFPASRPPWWAAMYRPRREKMGFASASPVIARVVLFQPPRDALQRKAPFSFASVFPSKKRTKKRVSFECRFRSIEAFSSFSSITRAIHQV
jgi:hypothetical protein